MKFPRLAAIASLFRKPAGWMAPESVLGLAWYKEEQWPRLLDVSVDGNRLEKTYEQWRRVAQAKFDELKQKGVNVVKVPVEVEDLASWCREMGRVVDGEGRVAYVKNRIAQVNMGNIDKL